MLKWRNKFHEIHSIDSLSFEKRKEFEKIIERFKIQHPDLIKLEPEIGIGHISQDEEGNPLEIFYLCIGHPFIFDYRLIPTQFEDLDVEAEQWDKMPPEFPEEVWMDIQEEVYKSPERYGRFVERNFKRIKKELKRENLTIDEALDALTRDFAKHKEWAEGIVEKRRIINEKHILKFNDLLKKTKIAYNNSDIKKHPDNRDWGYSVTATSFKKNEKVIVGFNWGVDQKWVDGGGIYGPQDEYPLINFASCYKDLGSFKRVLPLFYKWFESLPQVQINYCFFRSEKEDQIIPEDLKLCDDLFNDLIEYLEPSMLISFSKKLDNYLKKGTKLEFEEKVVLSGNRHIYITNGSIEIGGKKIPYYYLPHPNYPIKREAIYEAWKYCFGEPKFKQ